MPDAGRYLQRNQPEGVPPLELTGERTLPDVPEENYWYRRHLAVYEWIAGAGRRAAGRRPRLRRGLRLRCARRRRRAEVVGVDANPEAHEHARLRYRRPNLRFERDLVETFAGPLRRDRLPADDRAHRGRPGAARRDFARGAPVLAYISTPNRLTLAPEGAEKSDNPWHLREYTAAEYRALLEPPFGSVELLGLFHARKLRAPRARDRRWAGTASTRALRITKPFYDRFMPAISASDFALRPAGEATSTGRWTSWPSADA